MRLSRPSRGGGRLIAGHAALLLGLVALIAMACSDHSSPTDPASRSPAPSGPPAVVQPACADPAPLYGHPDPRAAGYIVAFQEGTDAASAAGELADRYGFEILGVFQVLPGFHAELSPQVVAALRCEPVVASVEYNGVVTAF